MQNAAAHDEAAAPARVQQHGGASKDNRCAAPARFRRKAAADAQGEADTGFSSDSSDLPEGIVGSSASKPELNRLKRKHKMGEPDTQPIGGELHMKPASSAHAPQRCMRPVRLDSGDGAMKASPASRSQALQAQPLQLGRLFGKGSTRAHAVTQAPAKRARLHACQASGAPAACNPGVHLPHASCAVLLRKCRSRQPVMPTPVRSLTQDSNAHTK